MCAKIINREWENYSLLDVGCRNMELKPLLNGFRHYHGIDLFEGEGVTCHDLERPIPFENESFEVVVALDVVEHVENAHQLVSELVRVASGAVIISLPNMYYWRFRMKMLFGKMIGGKYFFSPIPVKDRHRWLPSYDSAVDFVIKNTAGCLVEIIPIIADRNKFKLLRIMESIGAKMAPNFFNYGIMFIVKK